MIGNILDNTTELYMIKYTFGEIFSSSGATLYKNPSDQTVYNSYWKPHIFDACILVIYCRHQLRKLPTLPAYINAQK